MTGATSNEHKLLQVSCVHTVKLKIWNLKLTPLEVWKIWGHAQSIFFGGFKPAFPEVWKRDVLAIGKYMNYVHMSIVFAHLLVLVQLWTQICYDMLALPHNTVRSPFAKRSVFVGYFGINPN